jgi:hypothetical protein
MSNRHKAKHNTTRSKHTSDKRPPYAQKQIEGTDLDPTGSKNPHSELSSNMNRGQTLGDGPWNHQSQMPQGYEPSPFN